MINVQRSKTDNSRPYFGIGDESKYNSCMYNDNCCTSSSCCNDGNRNKLQNNFYTFDSEKFKAVSTNILLKDEAIRRGIIPQRNPVFPSFSLRSSVPPVFRPPSVTSSYLAKLPPARFQSNDVVYPSQILVDTVQPMYPFIDTVKNKADVLLNNVSTVNDLKVVQHDGGNIEKDHEDEEQAEKRDIGTEGDVELAREKQKINEKLIYQEEQNRTKNEEQEKKIKIISTDVSPTLNIAAKNHPNFKFKISSSSKEPIISHFRGDHAGDVSDKIYRVMNKNMETIPYCYHHRIGYYPPENPNDFSRFYHYGFEYLIGGNFYLSDRGAQLLGCVKKYA